MNEPLHCHREGAVLELTLNRPARRNALSRDLIAAMIETVHQATADAAVHVVLLTGAPPAFCAGLDLDEMPANATQHDITDLARLVDAIRALPKPLVAAVNGPAAAGGALLVTLADLASAAASATFGYPGIRRGLVAPIVIDPLRDAAGSRHAHHLLLTGDMIDADRARALGLVTSVVPDGELLAHARTQAASLAALPSAALARTKALLREPRIPPDDARHVAQCPPDAD